MMKTIPLYKRVVLSKTKMIVFLQENTISVIILKNVTFNATC